MEGQATGALVRQDQQIERYVPSSIELENQRSLAEMFASSGYFKDASDLAQAFVKIQAGKEIGMPPMASMSGISIIDGKPSIGANLLAAAMKRGGYSWKLPKWDATGCEMELSYRGAPVGNVSFTAEDAKRAGLSGKKNWVTYPKSMYFARCISMAGRTYAPEVFGGITPYTPEELGAENVDENGNLIEVKITAPAQPKEPKEPKAVKPFEYKTMVLAFEQMKAKLAEAGSAASYYAVLEAHGLKHCNEIKSAPEGKAIYREMGGILNDLRLGEKTVGEQSDGTFVVDGGTNVDPS